MVRKGMTKRVIAAIVVMLTLVSHPTGAQAPAEPTSKTAAPGVDQKVGQPGNLDPGVSFINVVENAQVRILQITLQAGAVRRPHIHNDVLFSILVPITGALELTVDKDPIVTAVPGQAYYSARGQTHSFVNKTSAAVQIIEVFVRPDAAAAPAATAPAPPTAAPAPAAATPPPAGK
jgi:quercetin dioxygenase-like cupin family protein